MLKIIGWLLGIASMGFVGMYFDKGEVLAGFICVIAIGFFIPPLLNKINNNARKKAEAKGKEHKDLSLKASVIGGVVLLVLAGFLGAPSQPLTEEQKLVERKEECSDTITPMYYVEKAVKARLKSPSTADFPFYDKSQIQHLGDCVYHVRSYVDSQNGFGATIRSNFYVRIKRGETENDWQVQNIEIN